MSKMHPTGHLTLGSNPAFFRIHEAIESLVFTTNYRDHAAYSFFYNVHY